MLAPATTHCLFAVCLSGLFVLGSSHFRTLRAVADEPIAEWTIPDAGQLAAQREQIRNAADQLNRLLDTADDGPHWRRYLLWNSLKEAISEAVDEDPLRQREAMADLLSVYNRLADDHAGLERPEFQQLRREIRPRIRQLNAILTRRGRTESDARRKRLQSLLDENNWTGQAQSEWFQHLRWFDDRLQPLPVGIAKDPQPNICVELSASFIRSATATDVADLTDVNECIVGTRVIGDGITSGQGWLSPAPSNDGACLIARFEGALDSDTIGYNGPVRVYSDGYTRLSGSALLQLTKDGLQIVSSEVDAAATSRTKGVSTKFRGVVDHLVRRIACRQIAEKKVQANWEASSKARASFRTRFAGDVSRQVSDGNNDFQDYLRLPLLRRDLMPEQWIWTSSSSSLRTTARFDGRQRLPATTPRPKFQPRNAVHIMIHQSFLDNAAEGYFAGRLTELDDLALQDGIGDSADPSDVAVRLDDFQPLRCILDNDEVVLNLHGKQFVRGGTEYPAAVIEVKYRLEEKSGEMKLVQAGDPIVSPTPRFARAPRFGIGGAALRAAIEPTLKQNLPKEIDLTYPEIEFDVPDAVRRLRVVDASTEGGWLHLALDSTSK